MYMRLIKVHNHDNFLALLDYVSRAHEIEIRPSSVVRRPSVRLWHQLSLNFMHGFLSNFSCGFPWAICPDVFFHFFLKKMKKIVWAYGPGEATTKI